MKRILMLTALVAAVSAPISHAQFGSGIVLDPTQSAHAAQQILQTSHLYTTTVETARNVIGAYNLAQQMASLPRTLYTSYRNLGQQQWTELSRPLNTYGNSILWMNAASSGSGVDSANLSASFPHIGRILGYNSLSQDGRLAIAVRGATVDLADAVSTSNLQTIGTIRRNSPQREAEISQLEVASHSTDPAQHTEMATLQRINQALLIQLRSQQETNQMLQAQALQQLIEQKTQQDNLKSLFQLGNGYQQNFNAATPQQTSAGTKWAFHY
jgi:hypothetical protein